MPGEPDQSPDPPDGPADQAQTRRDHSDPSEAKAEDILRREAVAESTYRDGQSVYDEPNIFPGRDGTPIEQDWTCSVCGYNLRGLVVGHRCPECGHRELYVPPPPGVDSYRTWLQARLAATSSRACWTAAVLAALCGGPWAVLAALLHTGRVGLGGLNAFVLAVVWGPVVEETMKIAAAAYVAELRPYLFRRVDQVRLATAGSALLFAVIENLLYLHVYVPNHSTAFAVWRWTVCVALHVVCTSIASIGLINVWQEAIGEFRRPRVSQGFWMLTVGILVHACYNAAVLGYESLFG